tara:strand:- start:153 stop:641 length:489 start_codon:yes stop_codon:yes gene_type:complete
MNIQQDFAKGKQGEDIVKSLLAKAGIASTDNKVKSNLSYYDISSDSESVNFTVEVKNDLYAEKSGNIAIEIYNPVSNKKSGISITKSDLWAHIAMNQVWVANTKSLKEYIRKNKPFRTIKKAGDGNATIMLYKAKKIFKDCFFRIDNLTAEKIYSTVTDLLE